MIVPLREHQWRPPITHRLDDVVADPTSAKLVVDQLLVDSLELDTLVSIWTSLRLERGRLHEDIVLEGMGRRLHPRVHARSHWAALHKDDRMVPVLARDGRGESHDESRFGLACHLLEAVRRQVMAFVDDQGPGGGDRVIANT